MEGRKDLPLSLQGCLPVSLLGLGSAFQSAWRCPSAFRGVVANAPPRRSIQQDDESLGGGEEVEQKPGRSRGPRVDPDLGLEVGVGRTMA